MSGDAQMTDVASHAPTRREPCGNTGPRSTRRVMDPPDHTCDRRARHNEALCRCSCGRDFRPPRPDPVTAADWVAEGMFWLRVADDRVREADRARWSSKPEHQRTEDEKFYLIHNSLGANAAAAGCLSHAQKMLTEQDNMPAQEASDD